MGEFRLRVGLVGCGRVGRRRADVIASSGDALEVVADLEPDRAGDLASRHGCRATCDWRRVTASDAVEAVVVSTFHASLAEISLDALGHGKHVLCEKPLARNAAEALGVVACARAHGRVLKVGLTHRFHPHVAAARRIVAGGEVGRPLLARAVFGHGGRPGMEGEWRASHAAAGGGALLDQGVHVVDFLRWFLGEFDEVTAWTAGYVWGDGVPPSVEDNVFALLRGPAGVVASMHVSWTQWRNRFSLEVYGEDGYAAVEGLGGETYGSPALVVGRRRPAAGPPDEERTAYPATDTSWDADWQEFRSAIREGREPLGSGADAVAALRILDAMYASSAGSRAVRVGPHPDPPPARGGGV